MDAYIVWDLIHDRTHMHGDLPVRPVHDPPAQPLLDVLAGGAALRPDRVRRGREARARGLRVRALRAVRDPLRPPLPLPGHRQPGAQLRRPRRPAPVRLPAQGGLPALDRQPADDRLGAGRRRRRRACASRSRTSTTPASTARSSASGSPPTTSSPPTCRRPRARSGPQAGRDLPEVEEPKELVDLVKDDEFPLSLFYVQLAAEARAGARRPPRRAAVSRGVAR